MVNLNTPQLIAQHYPLYLTQKNFVGWRALFHETANIVRLEKNVQVEVFGLNDCVKEQQTYALQAKVFTETWSEVSVQQQGEIAIIKANYLLIADREQREGLDVLVVAQTEQGWRIMSLFDEQTQFTLLER